MIAWKKDDDTWEEKPYPNEHACRLEDPDKYIRIRRQNDKFGKGIHAIWGVQAGSKPVELQAIRFAKSKFTAAEARAWLKSHDYKCKLFEPSSEKCEKCEKPMLIKWEQDVSGEKCELTCEASFSYIHDGECVEECKKAEHFIEKCSKCGKTIMTCRCSSPDKVVRLSICSECKVKDVESELTICQGCKKPVKYADVPESGMGYIKCPNCGKFIDQVGKVLDDKEDKQVDGGDVTELPADPESDEDVGFVMVDADAVRKDNGTEDFIHGGHHYIFDFIPEPEIWIDERMTDEDIMQIKCSLFVERECMKYCDMNSQEPGDMGAMTGKGVRHLMDPMAEGGGHHDEKDLHYFMHDGNHWHNRGQTVRWDNQTERYEIHSIVDGSIINLTKEQKESYENDIDEAIKQVAIKYGLREAPPAEPEVVEEKPAVNPPEPRKIVIFTDEDRKKAEQDRKKQLSEMLEPVVIQIGEVIKKIPEIVKEEMDRLRGKVK